MTLSSSSVDAAAVAAAKAPVIARLRKAVELELSTLPPYITAFASIHPGTNREPASIIHSVFMEEMLHMLLAGNVLSAIGGTVQMGPDTVPSYPLTLEFEGRAFRNREFEVDLGRFSPQAVETFKNIEMPDDLMQTRRAAAPEEAAFEIEGETIGQFYWRIQVRLTELCELFGEAAVFSGDPAWQVTEQFYWFGGGKPVVVTDLASANAAIEVIVQQGEGANGNIGDGDAVNFGQREEVAHYFRFNEIAAGRCYAPGDTPQEPPSGRPIAVDYQAVYPILGNPTSASYASGSELYHLNDEFNRAYSMMLTQIAEGMSGNPRVLYTAIENGMHRLARVARRMMKLPIPGDAQGRHGAPSFEWVQPRV